MAAMVGRRETGWTGRVPPWWHKGTGGTKLDVLVASHSVRSLCCSGNKRIGQRFPGQAQLPGTPLWGAVYLELSSR